jgi:hypothetical protein
VLRRKKQHKLAKEKIAAKEKIRPKVVNWRFL